MEFITINSDFKIYIIYDLFVFLNLRSIIDFLDFNKNVINQNYRLLKVFYNFLCGSESPELFQLAVEPRVSLAGPIYASYFEKCLKER